VHALSTTRDGTITTPDGRALAYVERGDPDAPAIVHHHGTPGSRLTGHPDPATYDGIRVVTYDRPGYGGSDPQPGRTVVSAAADVEVLAGALGLERFTVLGVSGGGPHALACSALMPDRVTRVAVLVGGGPSDDPDFDFVQGMSELNVREFRAAQKGEEELLREIGPYAEAMQQDPDAILDLLTSEVPEPDQAMMARPELRAMMRASFLESVRQGARGWLDDDLAFVRPWGFRLEDVPAEVRLWQGELDVLVPHAHAEYMARRLPNATFELIPDAGHLIYDHYRPAYEWLAGAA
jgi:pimeloyl-ACP methyl ester carboxylesterase